MLGLALRGASALSKAAKAQMARGAQVARRNQNLVVARPGGDEGGGGGGAIDYQSHLRLCPCICTCSC